jgi:hypothetical protein
MEPSPTKAQWAFFIRVKPTRCRARPSPGLHPTPCRACSRRWSPSSRPHHTPGLHRLSSAPRTALDPTRPSPSPEHEAAMRDEVRSSSAAPLDRPQARSASPPPTPVARYVHSPPHHASLGRGAPRRVSDAGSLFGHRIGARAALAGCAVNRAGEISNFFPCRFRSTCNYCSVGWSE